MQKSQYFPIISDPDPSNEKLIELDIFFRPDYYDLCY